MDPDLRFFFGSTSRPVMIKLNYEFTLFDAEFDDCTGLHLMRDDLDAHAGLNLRSPKEICGLASWLGSLKPPALADGESIQLSHAQPGFSPEFEDESIERSEDFDGYDATELTLSAVWHRDDNHKGLCLHLAANEPDGLDVQGVPAHLIPHLCEALTIFAREWKVGRVDLALDQPLSHILAS